MQLSIPAQPEQCCATCVHWQTGREGRKVHRYCPVIRARLPKYITAYGCEQWEKEPLESEALEVYERLQNG
jgi:hypothetical protein